MKERKEMGKVNERRIMPSKIYPWYYTENMDVNLVPIGYYTRLQAAMTLSRQFGPEALKELHLIQGSSAIKNKWKFGKNTFTFRGKRQQVKKYLFPAEMAYNKARRRRYSKHLNNFINSTLGRSGRKHYLNQFFIKTYGYRDNFY